jgi:hypothetical protein
LASQAYASKLSDSGLPEFGPIAPVGRSWMVAMLSGRRFSVEQVIGKGDRADGAWQASVCRNPEGSESSRKFTESNVAAIVAKVDVVGR